MSNEFMMISLDGLKPSHQFLNHLIKLLGEDWNGGMPYLSISHYKSGTGNKNVPGMPTKIYRDGNSLKACWCFT